MERHGIYGVNRFIREQCERYFDLGFDVCCPNMIGDAEFSYQEASEAYPYFYRYAYTGAADGLLGLHNRIRPYYTNVFLLGFRVGAAIAWRNCEAKRCNGIICCYGSRIRDHTDLQPACPVLLPFAKQDSFDVAGVVEELKGKNLLSIYRLNAGHGFLDPNSGHYSPGQAVKANGRISSFLCELTE